jgi:DNA-directed RNA polymerase specialized sigma24 family protein
MTRTAAVPLAAASYPSDLADLQRVDPVTRGLLYLVEVEGASVGEAASAVGCSALAARTRLSRGRRQLRGALDAEARDD